MKKNKAMRLASLLLVMVLLTTSIISGTFAKYTTSAASNDSARVARWGVAVTATSNSAFDTSYATDDSAYSASITNSVESTSSVLAPGTSGTLTAVSISGTPEVAVEVSYSAVFTFTGWSVNNEEYFPVVITVGSDTYGLTGIKDSNGNAATKACTNIADLKSKLEAAVSNCTAEYDPGADLIQKPVPSISWDWAFESAGNASNDTKDTALGNLSTAPTITVALTTTVTQID